MMRPGQPDYDDDRSVAAQIARALAERVIAGALAPGLKLRQDHVAAEFRASHVPVREAFRVLEAQGLVIGTPRRGVRVAPLDPRTLLEVTEMRAALEPLALRHAAVRLGDAALAGAAAALAQGEASADIFAWERANRRFHRAITAPSGLPRLMAAIDGLHQASARYLLAVWKDLAWRPRSDHEHRAILADLAAGDGEAAAAALQAHVLAAGRALAVRLETAPATGL